MSETTQLLNPNDIRLAKQFSGSGERFNIPFIPILRINNKEEEKEIEVEGTLTKVKIPARKGFLIKTKTDDGQYPEEFWGEELNGVVLKERYEIQSKFDVQERYFSYEFDTWTEPVKVYDTNRNVLIEAPYSTLKGHFATEELDSFGNKRKTFDLFLVLYVNVNNEVKRFKWKMSEYNKWFLYKNNFNEDTYVGYITKFNLVQEKKGDNQFWVVNYEKGDPVNLTEQIELQKQILKFMGALKETYDPSKWQDGPSRDNGVQVVEEEEISIDDIPF